MEATENEVKLLLAIYNDDFQDCPRGEGRIDNYVWSEDLDFPKASVAGTLSSLVKKGLAGQSGRGRDAGCCIRRAGFDLLREKGLV